MLNQHPLTLFNIALITFHSYSDTSFKNKTVREKVLKQIITVINFNDVI